MTPDAGRLLLSTRYATLQAAEAALAAVAPLEPYDAVLVTRDAAGRVDLRQTHGAGVGEGAVVGGTVGLLAGLVLGLPVGAAVAGALAGGGFGAHDTGIADDLLRRLGCELAPDETLLCLLVDERSLGAVRELLAPYGSVPVDAGAAVG